MRTCRGCGGVLGRDCFNEPECAWISEDIERRQRESRRPDQGAEILEQMERDYYAGMEYDYWRALLYGARLERVEALGDATVARKLGVLA